MDWNYNYTSPVDNPIRFYDAAISEHCNSFFLDYHGQAAQLSFPVHFPTGLQSEYETFRAALQHHSLAMFRDQHAYSEPVAAHAAAQVHHLLSQRLLALATIQDLSRRVAAATHHDHDHDHDQKQQQQQQHPHNSLDAWLYRDKLRFRLANQSGFPVVERIRALPSEKLRNVPGAAPLLSSTATITTTTTTTTTTTNPTKTQSTKTASASVVHRRPSELFPMVVASTGRNRATGRVRFPLHSDLAGGGGDDDDAIRMDDCSFVCARDLTADADNVRRLRDMSWHVHALGQIRAARAGMTRRTQRKLVVPELRGVIYEILQQPPQNDKSQREREQQQQQQEQEQQSHHRRLRPLRSRHPVSSSSSSGSGSGIGSSIGIGSGIGIDNLCANDNVKAIAIGFVMEPISCPRPLDMLLASETTPPSPPAEKVRQWVEQVCRTIQWLHREGIAWGGSVDCGGTNPSNNDNDNDNNHGNRLRSAIFIDANHVAWLMEGFRKPTPAAFASDWRAMQGLCRAHGLVLAELKAGGTKTTTTTTGKSVAAAAAASSTTAKQKRGYRRANTSKGSR